MKAVKPAHFRATWNETTLAVVHYVCMEHEAQLRAHAEGRAPVFKVPPSERDNASVWCSYCSRQD